MPAPSNLSQKHADRPVEPLAGSSGQQTMASMLCERIRADIIRGDFQPGQKLKVADISGRYGMGAIPVREALSRLANSGFVESRDQRGFAVREVSADELRDITRVRVLMEAAALREAIEQGDVQWEARVIGALHALSKFPIFSNDRKDIINHEWEAAHDELHRQLLSGCQSPWLIRITSELRDQATRYRHISVASHATPSRNVGDEHAGIVEAAVSRKADLAVALACEHILTSTRIALAEIPDGPGARRRSLSGQFPATVNLALASAARSRSTA